MIGNYRRIKDGAALCVAALLCLVPLHSGDGVLLEKKDQARFHKQRTDRQRQLANRDRPIRLPSLTDVLAQDDRVSQALPQLVGDLPEDDVDLILTFDLPPGSAQMQAVVDLGGSVNQIFGEINGFSVTIPATQVAKLLDLDTAGAELTQIGWDAPVGAALDVGRVAAKVPGTPGISGVLEITGDRITIAVLDSGVMSHPDFDTRLIGCVDLVEVDSFLEQGFAGAIPSQKARDYATLQACKVTDDPYGHGTHVAGIIAGSGAASGLLYRGVAPKAHLLSVRVLDHEGAGNVSDLISAIDWVIANKDEHDIRLINMSLGGPFFVHAAKDPLIQAVERAWEAGIVVVCSAGNFGTYGNFMITRPGNSPRVITVGSLTDWNSTVDPDDMVSSFSSRGPTLMDLTLKPDLVAPGNRIISTRSPGSALDSTFPDWQVAGSYFELSGTSMAAPMVAGSAALMLQVDPSLNPDTIKARLMITADDMNGSPVDHGAGRLNLDAALQHSGVTTNAASPQLTRDPVCCGLTIDGVENDWGALWSSTALWSDATLNGDTALWSDSALWSDTALWSDAALWSDTALWSDAALWSDTALWSDSVTVGE